jgi:polyhydroxyalkanoate synthesis regulator phasin
MNRNKILAGALSLALLGMSFNAAADATEDLVNALVTKGVLTEDEGALLTKGVNGESKKNSKDIKSKLTISDKLEKATLYGDIRVRHETRQADNSAGTDSLSRNRERYKITLGVKTEIANDWYTDLALAMGSAGRSDNATLGAFSSSGDKYQDSKQTLYVKRAMIGWNAQDWLTIEAGRIKNPLYTTQMVWDKDLTWDGVALKGKWKLDNKQTEIFANLGADQISGDQKDYDVASDNATNWLLAAQVGGKHKWDSSSLKTGLTYTDYTHDTEYLTGNALYFTPTAPTADLLANMYINDLRTIEIPFTFLTMMGNGTGLKVFGDYVKNLDGDDRWKNAGNLGKDDDTAWMLGFGLASAKDFKALDKGSMAKGDWKADIWYQEVGTYSVDPNNVDSDFFDSKVNMKGTVLKAQYNIEDNVLFNVAYGHGKVNDSSNVTAGVKGDTSYDIDNMDLLQLDVTYKF